jgi:hypothetical protein
MFFRSSSLLFGLTASLLIAGCTSPTDEVWSPDEQRSDVGAVARGDANFPLRAGTTVPDANGVATTLTPTMQGFRVQFNEIVVKGTCDSDSGGHGEFYYQMGINGRAIARRSSDRSLSKREGESISIDASRVFFVEPNETFTVHVSVSDEDDFMNGADDSVGTRHIPYVARDFGSRSVWRDLDMGDDDCGVLVSYTLDRVQ